MNELFNRIIAWHEKNLPAGLPYEPLPQIGFLIEELGEINREFIKGDIDAAVGEITDLIVFSVNAIKILDKDYSFEGSFKLSSIDFSLLGYEGFMYFLHRDVISQMWLELGLKNISLLLVDYESIIDSCFSFIKYLGYSPELALLETVKKIESRRGAWNPESGKWEKEKNQPDVYKPDYSLAKL